MAPCASAACAMHACSAGMSVTSQGRKSGRTPCLAPSSSTKAVASERCTKATFAPCSRKPSVSAAPMPEPPPVMKTDWPSRS